MHQANTWRKLFAKKRQRIYASSYTGSVIHNVARPTWSNRNYSKFAHEGYIRNVIAHRCISIIASGAASVPWHLIMRRPRSTISVKRHILLDLLNRPNPCISGKEFLTTIYSHKLLSGNAFIQAVRDRSTIPIELYALRPDRVSIISDKGCIPYKFTYKINNIKRDFLVNKITGESDILHIKQFHPLNDWSGLSSIEAAAHSIDQHNEAMSWNQALLQNGARPSGALIVHNDGNGMARHLSETEYLRLKGQMEEMHTGSANAGRAILLEGGLDWKEISISPRDMDFISAKHSAARDIALAFGVPPQLLGIPGDATYNNMAEARLSLWEQTIIPLAESLTCDLNHWLIPMFDKRLQLKCNLDEVSALTPRREAIWNRVNKATFLSKEQKLKILNP